MRDLHGEFQVNPLLIGLTYVQYQYIVHCAVFIYVIYIHINSVPIATHVADRNLDTARQLVV